MNKVLGCLSMAALVVVLAAPVSAQDLTSRNSPLKATVPFDFVIGGRTMSAGDYVISTLDNGAVLAVRNVSSGTTPALTTSSLAARPGHGGQVLLTFHRYGNDYFLAEIWDGYRGIDRSIPMSRTERETAKGASIDKPEMVMVLARL